MRFFAKISLVTMAILCMAGMLWGAVPRLITFQGRVTDAAGNPLPTGTYQIQFRLYDAAVGGSTFWDNGVRQVPVADGMLVYQLGDSTALPATVFAVDTSIWLGIKVGADAEIVPRTRLTSTSYAYKALMADTAFQIRDGSIVDADVDVSAGIQASKVNGTAATLSFPNTFTASGNAFDYGLTVGTLGDLIVEESDLVLRYDGKHRWRLRDDNTTGLQFKQVYDDDGGLKNDVRLEIDDSGNVAIDTVPNSQYKLLVLPPRYNTTASRHGVYTVVSSNSTGVLCGMFGVAEHMTAGGGGDAYGVRGTARSDDGDRVGVYGVAEAQTSFLTTGYSYGVRGSAYYGDRAYGIYGYASGGVTHNYAGYFSGSAHVTGTLSKGAGSFKIDHPLDPENKYLQHSFVESPDMMNVYNGNVILGADGTAVVMLPDYFEALNTDFRYQLTAVGAAAPNLHISQKIEQNRFVIAGGSPGTEVSWQVTGVRKDPYAAANRIQVEIVKMASDRGKYAHPEAYGLSSEKGIDYEAVATMKSSIDKKDNSE